MYACSLIGRVEGKACDSEEPSGAIQALEADMSASREKIIRRGVYFLTVKGMAENRASKEVDHGFISLGR